MIFLRNVFVAIDEERIKDFYDYGKKTLLEQVEDIERVEQILNKKTEEKVL